MDRARLDLVLAAEWVGDPASLEMDDLRAKRSELQGAEVTLSYQRRMAQGRLDIVAAERRRRRAGSQPLDRDHIVAELTQILAPSTRAPGSGRLSRLLAPAPPEAETPEIDHLAGPEILAALPELSDAALDELITALSAVEARCSALRRQLHDRIDLLQGEVVRRYRDGEATVESLIR